MRQKNPYPDKELSLRIKTILILRVTLLAVIVGLIFAFQIRSSFRPPIVPLSVCVGAAFFLSLIYALLFKKCRDLSTTAAAQSVGDLLVVTGFLYSTGGIQSPFSFLYILVIIATGIMLPRAASYLVASGACILYGLLVDLEYYNVINPIYFFPKTSVDHEIGFVFYKILLNLCSFFSVAYLTSMLSERLNIVKEELSSKSADLRDLQEFHQNVVINMGNGLWTTDLAGRITSMNRAAEDITGFGSRETLGNYCYTLLEIPELKTFFEDRTLFTNSFQIENNCRGKNQKRILIRMKVSRLLERDSQVKGFICVFEDLTELREMERKILQSEKLAALGKISAGLAHELRNPLASLSGSIQFLQKELKIKGENKRLMEIVMKETQRLNSIVTDFLNYSYPPTKKATMVDLHQVVQDVLSLLKNSKELAPTIKIESREHGEHFFCRGNEKQIHQVVWNLCINGLESMRGKGTLRTTLEHTEGISPGGDHKVENGVVLKVEDEGIGISREDVKKIFDPFFTTKEMGVGLGLATVYQIVRQCGGLINVESEPGKGTRFALFFPYPEEQPSRKQNLTDSTVR